MKKKTGCVLIELGVTPDLIGFDYICDAVDFINSESIHHKIVEIYEYIADKNNVDSLSKIERGIKTAIRRADPKNPDYARYFGKKIVNSAVLYTLAYKMREED